MVPYVGPLGLKSWVEMIEYDTDMAFVMTSLTSQGLSKALLMDNCKLSRGVKRTNLQDGPHAGTPGLPCC